MAQTLSAMPELGMKAPNISLQNVMDDRKFSLSDCRGAPATLVMFICNHCPYVVHVRDEFKRLADDYMPRGVSIVAINSNSSITHPQDGPVHMRRLALELKWPFPFLFDETQEAARAFEAACTPDFYLFDSNLSLVYRGQLDDARPGNGKPVNGKDVRAALDAVLSGAAARSDQRPSMGCNIKWAPGHEPD